MSAPEWSPGVPVTIDNLEPVYLACISAGDTQGVDACLRLAVAVDPRVASEWFDALSVAVLVRQADLTDDYREDDET